MPGQMPGQDCRAVDDGSNCSGVSKHLFTLINAGMC